MVLILDKSYLHPIGDVKKAALGNTAVDRELLSYLMLKGAVIDVGYLSISVCKYLNLALQKQGFADSDKLKFSVLVELRNLLGIKSRGIFSRLIIKPETRLGDLLWQDIRRDSSFLPSNSFESVRFLEDEDQD